MRDEQLCRDRVEMGEREHQDADNHHHEQKLVPHADGGSNTFARSRPSDSSRASKLYTVLCSAPWYSKTRLISFIQRNECRKRHKNGDTQDSVDAVEEQGAFKTQPALKKTRQE